ncbi:MAG TPA: SpoIIE family protein phosphatase [Yinghuangia sp.]|nr:SpoIIE family protein phosphatase [Yinghuangia sp.]
MCGTHIDYQAVYQALPGAIALLTPDLMVADVNERYLSVAGRRREQLLGRHLFDLFPDNPADPRATGAKKLQESFRRVLSTGERDTLTLHRYDVEEPDRPGVFKERYWSTVNTPVKNADGSIVLIVHRVEEVTELIRARDGLDGGQGLAADRARVLESELYDRARELQEINERLGIAHAREREVALALQAAMLPAPDALADRRVAVRYRPAVGSLNVCGDWFDLTELPGDRLALDVGDIVGHGLGAACVMGQLRSALSAVAHVADGPAQALEALELYARSVEGGESAAVASLVVHRSARTITYSVAGNVPPALLGADGVVVFLDQATDPPLGALPEHLPRSQATTEYEDGATLVLYTDGLIERRDRDIDEGLACLAATLRRHRAAEPEALADRLLAELLPPGGNTDDTALVVVRL